MVKYADLKQDEQYAINAQLFVQQISEFQLRGNPPISLQEIDEAREKLAESIPPKNMELFKKLAFPKLAEVMHGLYIENLAMHGNLDYGRAATDPDIYRTLRKDSKEHGFDLDSWLEMLDMKVLSEDTTYRSHQARIDEIVRKSACTELPDSAVFKDLAVNDLSYARFLALVSRHEGFVGKFGSPDSRSSSSTRGLG